MFSLTGKTILIIGASRGLGESLALYLSKNDVNVIGVSRSFSRGKFQQFKCDITDSDQIAQLTKLLISKKIYVDGLVLNSGVTSESNTSIKKEKVLQSISEFKKIIDVNLLGIYNVVISILPLLNKSASIVGISSIGAQMAFPNNPAYQSSKASMNAMIRALAIDLAHLNIRANYLNLGYFKTKMTETSLNDPTLYKERKDRIILSRWGEKHEILGPVCFLLSDASSYITATGINVDGGWRSKAL